MDPNMMAMIQALQPGQGQDLDGVSAPSASIAATQQSSLGVPGAHPQSMYNAMMQPPPTAQPPAF